MVSDKNSEYKFTGGNSLTGIHKLYHEVMMLNELWNGYGAYEVSYAAGKSGISFGGNQMDMHDNKKTAEKFTNILISATDNAGKHFFTQGEVKMIVGNEFVNLIQNGEVVLSMLGDNLASINAALSSVYGRARIDELYVSEIKNGAEHIEKVIEKITNAAAKKFYDSDLGRVLLFDYHNQYDLKFDGRFLADYINGKGKENFSTKEMVVAPRDHYTIDDHKAYIQSTEQYVKNKNDCERRLSNIEDVLKKFGEVLISEIAEELHNFAFTFDKINDQWKIFPDVEMPIIPPPQGSQPFFFNSIIANYFFLPPSTQEITFKKDFFYYKADSKLLFHVKGDNALPFPGAEVDNANKWLTLSVGLSPIQPKPYLEFPGSINTQNYMLYVIEVKKVPVEMGQLMNWLGNAVVDGVQNIASLMDDISPLKKNVDYKEKSKDLQHFNGVHEESQIEADFFLIIRSDKKENVILEGNFHEETDAHLISFYETNSEPLLTESMFKSIQQMMNEDPQYTKKQDEILRLEDIIHSTQQLPITELINYFENSPQPSSINDKTIVESVIVNVPLLFIENSAPTLVHKLQMENQLPVSYSQFIA